MNVQQQCQSQHRKVVFLQVRQLCLVQTHWIHDIKVAAKGLWNSWASTKHLLHQFLSRETLRAAVPAQRDWRMFQFRPARKDLFPHPWRECALQALWTAAYFQIPSNKKVTWKLCILLYNICINSTISSAEPQGGLMFGFKGGCLPGSLSRCAQTWENETWCYVTFSLMLYSENKHLAQVSAIAVWYSYCLIKKYSEGNIKFNFNSFDVFVVFKSF